MSTDTLLRELDFVLTHPSCNVKNLESFYNNCLYVYESVPLIIILDHIHKEKPDLLKEWSQQNKTVGQLINDLGLIANEKDSYVIVEDEGTVSPAANGYYKMLWKTDMNADKINDLFKKKKLKISNTLGDLEIVGFTPDNEENQYNLYLKKREG